MKRVAVISGDEVRDVDLQPGTTSADVLNQLGLSPDLFVSKRDGLPFGASECIYDQVRDGEKLYASAPAVVG